MGAVEFVLKRHGGGGPEVSHEDVGGRQQAAGGCVHHVRVQRGEV